MWNKINLNVYLPAPIVEEVDMTATAKTRWRAASLALQSYRENWNGKVKGGVNEG